MRGPPQGVQERGACFRCAVPDSLNGWESSGQLWRVSALENMGNNFYAVRFLGEDSRLILGRFDRSRYSSS